MRRWDDVGPLALGECPRWTGDDLLLVDVLGRTVLRRHADGRLLRTTTADTVGCVAPVVDRDDVLLAGVGGGVGLLDLATGAFAPLATLEQDARLRCNDGAVDPWGSLVVGTMDRTAARGRGGLWRVRPDGAAERLLAGCTIPNGLAWVDGGRTLLHVESGERRLTAYPYRPDGPLGEGRVLASWPAGGAGEPDGLCLDTEGRVWVALWGGARVEVLAPDGGLVAVHALPADQPSACALVGDHGVLVVTTARDGLATPGPDDGRVLELDVDAAGAACRRFGASGQP